MSAQQLPGAQSERTLLAMGITATLLGIAMSMGRAATFGAGLTLAGLVASMVGLHRFGRTGPDTPPSRKRRTPRKTRKADKKHRRPSD